MFEENPEAEPASLSKPNQKFRLKKTTKIQHLI